MKNKGFMLLETLIASTFILGTLIFLYIQFSAVQRTYEKSFKYNTITGLYHAKEMSSFLAEDGYSEIDEKMRDSTDDFLDITSCLYSSSLCKIVIKGIKANKVIYVGENISNLKNSLSLSNYDKDLFSGGLKDFILQMNTVEPNGRNRLIIEYQNNTYATITVEEDKS